MQRQFVVFSDAGRGFSPTRQFFEYGFRFHDGVSAIGKNVEELAAIAVSYADLERLDAIKNVQLGDTQPVDAVDHNGALHGCAVKPTAAARTACYRAEFLANRSQTRTDIICEFRGERARADPCGVRLCKDRKSTRLNSSHVKISYAV